MAHNLVTVTSNKKRRRSSLLNFRDRLENGLLIFPFFIRQWPQTDSRYIMDCHHKQSNQQRVQMEDDINLVRVRERQWMYMGPILAAPIAHISVTLYRDAKTPRQKQLLLGVGIVGSTVATIGMRLYLMAHAGYPGSHNPDVAQREKLVSIEKRNEMENPSLATVARETFKGFG